VSAETRVSLSVSATDLARVREALFTSDGCENFAVLFCGSASGPGWCRLLVREWLAAPPEAYAERLTYHLEIAPTFLNAVVDHALRRKLTPVVVHSHRGNAGARYSSSDDYGEARLLPVLEQLVPHGRPGSLLLTETSVIGRSFISEAFVAMDQVSVVGVRSELHFARGAKVRSSTILDFDRQVRAYGRSGQHLIQQLKVGIVGLGGTGSAVAEQLARLGIKDLLLVDPDVLEPSNVPRVWGAYPEDAGRGALKVDVAARHLRRIASDSAVRVNSGSVVRQSVLADLRDRDLVFGCTDNHLSRAVLNRFAHQYLVPVIDMGIRLDARAGQVTAAAGRVSLVGSSLTCLRCSHHISAEEVRLEAMPEGERAKLAGEGYVQGVAEPVPAVISMNTTVASLAVTAAMNLFVGLTGGTSPTTQIYDAGTGTVFVVSPRHEPFCDVCSDTGLKALGDAQVVTAYE
jgi:hypothetical protein